MIHSTEKTIAELGGQVSADDKKHQKLTIKSNLEKVTDGKLHHLYVVSKAINNNKDNEDISLYFLRFNGN